MKVLVTGASGFVGGALIRELNRARAAGEAAWDVVALLRGTSSEKALQGLQYQKATGSLGDEDSLKRACEGVEAVIHVAGVVTAPDRDSFFEHNARGTERLARIAASSGVGSFTLVSSLAAAGPSTPERARSEEDPESPVSAYGESKLAGEHAARALKSLPLRVVRPPMVYGPGDKATFLFFQSVHRGIVPRLPSRSPDGLKRYSAIHVEDLSRGIAAVAAAKGLPTGSTFYLTGDEIFTDRELFGAIEEALGKKTLSFVVPPLALRLAAVASEWAGKLSGRTPPLNRDKLAELFVDAWTCTNAKASRELGFRPRFTLKDGIAHTARWYQENGWL